MGVRAEEEGTGGLAAPPRLPLPGEAGATWAADRRERLTPLLERAAGVLAARLPEALLLPAAGRAAGAALAAGAAAGDGAGAAAAGLTTVVVTAGAAAAAVLVGALDDGATAAGGLECDPAEPGGTLALAWAAVAGAGLVTGLVLAAGLALLRVREVRLAIAQVGRGWRDKGG